MKYRPTILLRFICGGVLAASIAACGPTEARLSAPPPVTQLASSPALTVATAAAGQVAKGTMESRLASAHNQFGFALFHRLVAKEPAANVFFSPLSLALALTMTYNGAAGETQQALAQALHLTGMSFAEVNQASAALQKTLTRADSKIKLDIANSLWARQGVNFNADFLARNRQVFGAEIAALNFASPRATPTINNWVSRKTKGHIPTILERIDAQAVLFLLNAVYFKGQWQKQFAKSLTQEAPFYLLSGATRPVPLMSQTGRFQYFQGENFQALSLPYGQGHLSLDLFLPAPGTALQTFLAGVNQATWQQWLTRFQEREGEIKIPRCKLAYEATLNDPLQALGMAVAFTPGRADFSGMRKQRDLFLSAVKHKAVLDLNEQGTEAAAATSTGMSVTSVMPPTEKFTLVANRPFLLVIRHQQSGAILFLGVVTEPK
jgi:serpin B